MSRSEPAGAGAPSATDRDRYAAALAAAADPESVFDAILQVFGRLRGAMRAGDRAGAAAAARALELHCLRFCTSAAPSAVAADDRRRVAQIIIGWAWPRRPALAAVLEADTAREARRWGEEVAGEA